MMPTSRRVLDFASCFSRDRAYGVDEHDNVQWYGRDLSEGFANTFKSHQSVSGNTARLRMTDRRQYIVTRMKVYARQAAKGSM